MDHVAKPTSEDPIQRLFALSVDMLGTASRDGYFTRLNPAWERTLGWTSEELMAEPLIGFVHPDDVEATRAVAARLANPEGATVVGFENRFRTRAGDHRWLRSTTVAEGGVLYFVATDVTEHRTADQLLQSSEALHRTLTANLPDTSVFLIDQDLRILIADGEAIRRLPWLDEDMFRGRTVIDLYAEVPPDVLELSLTTYRAALRGERGGFEFASDGLRFAIQAVPVRGSDGTVVSALVVATDITEGARAAQQLSQARRLESVGQLAGGVAHDFNNLLTVIAGYGELARQRVGTGPGAAELVEIAAATDRAATLTQQLLAFARHQVLEPEPIDVGAVVAEIVPMLERLIGDVQIAVHAEPDLPLVVADRGKLEQVVVNLVVNARDAMPSGGALTIETRAIELEAPDADAREMEAGPHVQLAVTDTGTGIDPQLLEHIFEPFFTSKEVGRGTGLGLATVHGIIGQLGGRVLVYTEPGHGTTFKMYFPVAPEDTSSAPAATPAVDQPQRAAGGETIVVCEDEEAIRRLIERILVRDGYTVRSAATPDEALTLAGADAPIDALVSDVILPRMSGPELATVLRGRQPGLRTLFLSGYTAETLRGRDGLPADSAFLEKPFDAAALRRAVRALLDAP